MPTVTRESILKALSSYAAGTTGKLTFTEFQTTSGISFAYVYRHFPQGWYQLLDTAGLQDRAGKRRPRSDHQLMTELHRLCATLGRMPRAGDLKTRAPFPPYLYENRYGDWRSIERAYRRWCHNQGIQESPERELGVASHRPTGPDATESASSPPPQSPASSTIGVRDNAPTWLGAPLAPHGLSYAPTNELGVVHLFGVLSHSLGFVVEQITGRGFPDCIALRQAGPDRWQRLRIEFEYKSSNFPAHNHDPMACDLIVCWQHDWPACPLEVVELRSILTPPPPAPPPP